MPNVPLGREERYPSEVPVLGASAKELSPSICLGTTFARGGNATTDHRSLRPGGESGTGEYPNRRRSAYHLAGQPISPRRSAYHGIPVRICIGRSAYCRSPRRSPKELRATRHHRAREVTAIRHSCA